MKILEKNKFLYAEERKQEILRLLEEQERVQVVDLVDIFQVSGSTIRTDMRELEKENLLTRTHGGAIKRTKKNIEDNPKVRVLTDEKRRIAQYAVKLIDNGDCLIIDTGTSCLAFAEALVHCDVKKLHIVTGDLQIASILSEQTDYEVCILGGVIRNGFQYAAGESVIRSIKTFSVDKAILATTSFTIEKGYSTPDIGTGELKDAMMSISKQKIMLCESSKIGKESYKVFAKPTIVDILVTDTGISKEDLVLLEEKNIYVKTV